MKVAALIEYTSDKDKIAAIRPSHRQYLGELLAAGKLAISGPTLDDWGAIIVYEADSLEEADKLLRADPFYAAGVFVRWTFRPWNPLFGNKGLLPG
ncbi:MAG: YciI family protein [Gemmataceae bacterium]